VSERTVVRVEHNGWIHLLVLREPVDQHLERFARHVLLRLAVAGDISEADEWRNRWCQRRRWVTPFYVHQAGDNWRDRSLVIYHYPN
jgi:hypothetical protein